MQNKDIEVCIKDILHRSFRIKSVCLFQASSKSDVWSESYLTNMADTEVAVKMVQNKDTKVVVHNFLIQSFRVKF